MRTQKALRQAASALIALFAIGASAQNGAINITCYPERSVADGRSTITVSVEIRDSSGRIVPDNTQVLLTTTLGSFRENVVSTVSGLARGILVAGTTPGTAKITATATAFNASRNVEVEFVGDRSLLSSSNEYIEVVSPKDLIYSPEMRTLAASGPNKGVKLRYKDIEIEADDLQLKVPAYEVRARRAKLKLGKSWRDYDELYIKLNQRRGFGMTTLDVETLRLAPGAKFIVGVRETRQRIGFVEVKSDGNMPVKGTVDSTRFLFEDLSNSVTMISSRKSTVYPNREIQFQRADIMMGGQKLMRMPLFQLSAQNSQPVITDQFVNVTNNQLAINYPYYLSLKPGETSLLRFRQGTRYGTGAGASGGTFLDYEMRWNRGDEMQGGVTLGGIGRNDWGVNARQFLKFNDRTSLSAQLDLPAHRSLFGSANLTHNLNGFLFNLSANGGRSISGLPYSNSQLYMSLESDPIRIESTPLRFSYGIVASQNSFKTSQGSSSQTSYGLHTRLQSGSIRLSKTSSLTGSATMSQQAGRNVRRGLAYGGDFTFASQLSQNFPLLLTYSYLDDGFNSVFLGRHRLTMNTSLDLKQINLRFLGTRSLDRDRFEMVAGASWRLNRIWRLGWDYAYNRYDANVFSEMSLLLGYRIGFREVGLSWSSRTKRIGFELFGASFN